jgi:hypothetical protein
MKQKRKIRGYYLYESVGLSQAAYAWGINNTGDIAGYYYPLALYGNFDHRSQKIGLVTSHPEFNAEKFLFLSLTCLVGGMIAQIVSKKNYLIN